MEVVKISDSEAEVMEIIWDKGETTAHEVHSELLKKKKWAYNTVATFMQRLCDKGFLKIRREGKSNLYSCLISREEYKKSLTREFLNSIHKGSKKSLIAALFDKKLSDEEIDELLNIIDKS